jgi:hypothetical protein
MANIDYFVYHTAGNIDGVELYKKTQSGDFIALNAEESTIDPELIYSDYKVEAGALVEMSQAEKDAKAAPETLLTEQAFVAAELHECDIMTRIFDTGDTTRQVATLAEWNTYAIQLRDYISNNGTITGSRPTRPV